MLEHLVRTDPIDFADVKEKVIAYHRSHHYEEPRVFYVRSPLEMVIYGAEILGGFLKAMDYAFDFSFEVESHVESGVKAKFGGRVTHPYLTDHWWAMGRIIGHSISHSGTSSSMRGTTGPGHVVSLINSWAGDLRRWTEYPEGWQRLKEKGLETMWATPRRQLAWSGPYGSYPAHGMTFQEAYEVWADLVPYIRSTHFASFIGERPEEICLDDQGRLSNFPGPAIKWRDGAGTYALHGVLIPKITGQLTVNKIDEVRNVETRRVLREQYGTEKYLADSGAVLIHADGFGELYRRARPMKGEQEPFAMVKVINSTAEPDGSFKDYFLRVPPTIDTAEEAVAWTFGMRKGQYAPLYQT